MKKIKTSFSRVIVSVILASSLFVGSVVPAHAAIDPSVLVNIVGIVVSLLSTKSSDSGAARARADLQKYWPDNRSSTRVEVSADDLWSACMDFNTSGVPCEIKYISGVGYTLRGTGACDLPDSSHSSSVIIQIIGDEFLVYDKYLHSYDGRLIYSSTQPSPKLLSSISSAVNDLLDQLILVKYDVNAIRNSLTSLIGYVDQIEGYIDGVENFLSSQITKLTNIGSYVDGVEGALSTTNTRLSTLIGHVDGVEGSLSDLNESVSSIFSLISPVQYLSHLNNSSGTQYSSITLPYDVASAYCALLNSRFVGKTVSLLDRNENSVSSHPTFQYATISGGYIRVKVSLVSGSDGTLYLSSPSHVLYAVDSSNTINLSGNVNATLNDSRIVSALNLINDSINGLAFSASDVVEQWCCGYSSYSDSTPYTSVSIPYEAAVSLVAQLNSELMGKRINQLSRDSDTTQATPLFYSCYLSNGRIRVVKSNSSVHSYLITPNHILIEYSAPAYETRLLSIGSSVSDLDTHLTSFSSDVSQKLNSIFLSVNNSFSVLGNIYDLLENNLGSDSADHQHTYVSEETREATCTAPGLITYKCSECGYSYSEIAPTLGHSFDLIEHGDAVFDENNNEIEAEYDVYECTRCGVVQRTYHGDDPNTGADTPISKLITSIFTRLGNLVGSIFDALLQLLDDLLTGFDSIVSDFNEKAQEIVSFGGDYPEWLSGVWDAFPPEFQLALSFCVVVALLGIIGKKLIFTS